MGLLNAIVRVVGDYSLNSAMARAAREHEAAITQRTRTHVHYPDRVVVKEGPSLSGLFETGTRGERGNLNLHHRDTGVSLRMTGDARASLFASAGRVIRQLTGGGHTMVSEQTAAGHAVEAQMDATTQGTRMGSRALGSVSSPYEQMNARQLQSMASQLARQR